MKRRSVFFILVFVEVFVLCVLGYWVYRRHYSFSVSPINKANLQFPTDTFLKYYYEWTPNTIVTEMRDWLQKPAVHTINSDGLNERYNYSVFKNSDTYRIITIGDSFTDGMFVDTKDNYSERLEDMLNANMHCKNITHFDVINLGVEGYDMQYILERYKRKGIKYDPDLVILMTTGTDFIFSNEDLQTKKKESMIQHPDEKIIEKQSEYFFELAHLIPNVLAVFTVPIGTTVPQIEGSIHAVQSLRSKTYVFPNLSGYDAFPDSHPSPKGHEQFAMRLYTELLKKQVIPCQ